MLVGKELLSPEWAERIHAFRHTGFSVHSLVRAKTKLEAERVRKYMIRPILSLERLSFSEKEGKICYRDGNELQVIHPLQLFGLFAIPVADLNLIIISFLYFKSRQPVIIDIIYIQYIHWRQ